MFATCYILRDVLKQVTSVPEDLYEKFHPGDDSLFCPELSEEMQAKLEEEMNEVLDRHLSSNDYSSYTFDASLQKNIPLANLDYVSMHMPKNLW